jgi:hypothetical protein
MPCPLLLLLLLLGLGAVVVCRWAVQSRGCGCCCRGEVHHPGAARVQGCALLHPARSPHRLAQQLVQVAAAAGMPPATVVLRLPGRRPAAGMHKVGKRLSTVFACPGG